MTPRFLISIFAGLTALMLAALSSCSPKLAPPAAVRDSVRVEIRERIVHDTVSIEIPREMERTVTRDTSSTLENSLARSTASVTAGELHHSLETKPQKIAVPVIHTVHDTTVVQAQAQTIIEYREKDLTGWQRFKQEAGGLLLGMALAAVVALVIKLLV